MNRTKRHRIGLLIALAAASCGLSPAIAQRDENPEPRFDIDFPGGTLSEYMDAFRKACPEGGPSVVVMPEALGLQVPPIRLIGITVEPAMEVLEGSYTTVDGLRARVDVRVLSRWERPRGSSVLAMKVSAEISSGNVSSAVWSVEEALIYGQTAEKILEAVEAAFSLFPTKAKISYHPPTRLLIVRGSQEQRFLVAGMLEQLIDGSQTRSEEMESIRRDIDELEADRDRMEAEMSISQKMAMVGKATLDRVMREMELGQGSPEEMAQAELEITRAETEFMMREQQRRRIEARLKDLHEAMKRYESKRE